MKKVISPIVLWLFTLPLSSFITPGKTLRKYPDPPAQITAVDSKLMIKFTLPPPRTCSKAPTDQANPALTDGAPTLTTANGYTYYCKVTIEPDSPTSTYNAATYKFTWTKKGDYLAIKVPKEASSKITVEFYEDCNSCINNQLARPMWKGSDIIQKGQPKVTVNLSFLVQVNC